MANNRDDFPSSVKRKLAERAGGRCSFPQCNQSTSGPSLDSHDVSINNGIAAHITAASPGGSRYDANMTSEVRGSIANGIWLCPTHASLIDKESSVYSTKQLQQWKAEAEYSARKSLEFNQQSTSSTENRTVHGSNFDLQPKLPYSNKDMRVLSLYSSILSYEVIRKISTRSFGSIIGRDITAPINTIENVYNDPAYKFQNNSLESLRQNLTCSATNFLNHIGRHIAGEDYINISEYKNLIPPDKEYWLKEINEAENLAREIADVAYELLVIKENS